MQQKVPFFSKISFKIPSKIDYKNLLFLLFKLEPRFNWELKQTQALIWTWAFIRNLSPDWALIQIDPLIEL